MQFSHTILSLTETKYNKIDDKRTLIENTKIQLTKNGRIKYAETVDANGSVIKTIEKKLFFNKISFPYKEAHYCKTRWKPNQRERLSCYTQKQYKENEVIAYYNKNGTVDKIEDNFTDFSTYLYNYNTKTNALETVVVLNKDGKNINKITYKCLQKDTFGNCTITEKHFSAINKIEIITYAFKYR